jgi:hypothetical protein
MLNIFRNACRSVSIQKRATTGCYSTATSNNTMGGLSNFLLDEGNKQAEQRTKLNVYNTGLPSEFFSPRRGLLRLTRTGAGGKFKFFRPGKVPLLLINS